MRLIDIQHGCITIQLDPPMCAALARLCQAGCQQSDLIETDHRALLAAFFRACAIAGYGQWHASAESEQAVLAQLKAENLV